MPERDFERQLGTLLRQTAADIPPELDVSARVHQKVYTSGGWYGSRRWVTVASMVAVVALLAGTFSWFRGAGTRPGPRPVPEPIVLHIDAAYADATATVVTFHLTGPRTDVAYSATSMALTDAAGNSLRPVFGGGNTSGGLYALFTPLPQPALGGWQTLTLTLTEVDLIPVHVNVTNSSVVPDRATVRGFWQARIAVTPIAGTSTPLRIPVQTHGKLSIQPLRLDVSPGSVPGVNYLPGGVRIVLRMSGLTPGTPQALGLATEYYSTPDSPIGTDPTLDGPEGGGSTGSGDPSSFSAAGGGGILPAFVYMLDAQGYAQGLDQLGQATVDTSGAIEFELIYLQSLQQQSLLQLPLQGPLMLTFDSITLNSGEKIPGPWVFTIPGA
jgi:hypothetical protein